MANLCIKTPNSAIQVLIFQLLVLRPRPSDDDNRSPVQVDKPSVSCLVIEVHAHRQHDVVASVVGRLQCNFRN